MSVEHLKAPPERLTCRCDPDSLGFETTADVEPLDSAIGQERAISALEMGLDIDAGGFNVFVSGVPGTGRNTTLRAHLERTAATKPNPPDWGYVYNFTDPAQPAPLCLPCGLMRMLAQDMEQLVETCREEIPAVFDSDDYRHRVQDILNDVQAQRQSVTDGYEKQARERGFTLSLTQTGVQVQITPVALHPEGRPLTQEEFAQLPEPVQAQLRERAAEVQHDIDHALAEFRQAEPAGSTTASAVSTWSWCATPCSRSSTACKRNTKNTGDGGLVPGRSGSRHGFPCRGVQATGR